ncbi:MAG: L-threonylcarbamoyladenylate synthase [Candidatus Bipolaricaulota bacterium]
MIPEVLNHDDPRAAPRLLEALETGQVVIFPTDTIYGMGGNPWDDRVLEKVREAKRRDTAQPVTIHVATTAEVEIYAEVTPRVRSLLRRLLPGPYTVILPARPAAPSCAVSSLGVGLRVPRHPFFASIVARVGRPLFGTSVNEHGEPPLRGIHEMIDRFPFVDLVFVGEVRGAPSDVLDLTDAAPRALRGTLPSWLAEEQEGHASHGQGRTDGSSPRDPFAKQDG